jgi:hypothetical protein
MQPVHQAAHVAIAELLRNQPLTPAQVGFAWRVAVGPALARVTRATLAPDGFLQVEATDAAWRRELVRSDALIRTRVEQLLGTRVNGLRIRPGAQ